ncbi:MAG: class I SAM-dependent methyltransferase [Candidatus Competibacterales bacterium]|nr:class I SAM-dependent methyltransferase [Candidatus Competibacterales bacterium]
MDIDAIRKSYRRYAASYDLYFGAVFQPGRKAVLDLMSCRRGDRILEVGVGTGLSLTMYPRDVSVVGIDVSTEMLAKARMRQQRERLEHVQLHEMDAEAMDFPDDSFDKVVAMYVASVVPHPRRLVDEMRRVCRPGGQLFIVNHFHSSHPVLSRMEKLIAPLSRLVGFRPDFSLDDFVDETRLEVVQRTPVNLLGYWTLLHARNSKSAESLETVMPAPVRVAAGR